MWEQNILLINPWIYDFAAYDFWLKPVGLLSIGSILRKFGYRVELIDCLDRFHPALGELKHAKPAKNKKYGTGKFYREVLPKPELFKHIPRFYARYGMPLSIFQQQLEQVTHPTVILITSGMTYWYPGVFQAIELVKQKWPGVPVILGGIYATLSADHARQYSQADFLITGPGELAALKLVDSLTGHDSKLNQFPVTLDAYPFPAYDLYSVLPALPILTSRGCPFRCPFCATRLLEPVFKQRNPAAVVREIEYYQTEFGVSEFAFWDDALLIHPERHFKVILNQILDSPLRAHFHLPNGIHPRKLTPDLAARMAACNFKTIRLSFESADRQQQAKMGNKVNNHDLEQAVQYLTNAGYAGKEIDVYLLMGLPGQSIDEIRNSISFVNRLGVKIRLSSFSPIPGTEAWRDALRLNQFPAAADPLLTNNSIFPLYPSTELFKQFEELKQQVRDLNLALG